MNKYNNKLSYALSMLVCSIFGAYEPAQAGGVSGGATLADATKKMVIVQDPICAHLMWTP
jgi:hypothetical protein